jgi:hypothetical protein
MIQEIGGIFDVTLLLCGVYIPHIPLKDSGTQTTRKHCGMRFPTVNLASLSLAKIQLERHFHVPYLQEKLSTKHLRAGMCRVMSNPHLRPWQRECAI